MENHFYNIRWAPLSVTIFIRHVHVLRNGCYANDFDKRQMEKMNTLQQTNFHYRVHKMLLNQSADLWLSLTRFNVMVDYKTEDIHFFKWLQ